MNEHDEALAALRERLRRADQTIFNLNARIGVMATTQTRDQARLFELHDRLRLAESALFAHPDAALAMLQRELDEVRRDFDELRACPPFTRMRGLINTDPVEVARCVVMHVRRWAERVKIRRCGPEVEDGDYTGDYGRSSLPKFSHSLGLLGYLAEQLAESGQINRLGDWSKPASLARWRSTSWP